MIVKKLSSYTKNFFIVSGVLFLLWMLFLDSNDIYSQYKLWEKMRALKKEKAYYQEKIDEVKTDREQLLTNEEMLEKFAREKYLMKKEGEDLYILVEE
jgi:cell division protein FtsB